MITFDRLYQYIIIPDKSGIVNNEFRMCQIRHQVMPDSNVLSNMHNVDRGLITYTELPDYTQTGISPCYFHILCYCTKYENNRKIAAA